MVQPAMEFKSENQPWKKVSVYCWQMLPQDPPATQDLQQTHARKTLDNNDLNQVESAVLAVSRGLSHQNALEANQYGGFRRLMFRMLRFAFIYDEECI